MSSTLSDLYYGNYSAFNRRHDPGSSYMKTFSALSDLEDEIERSLTGEEKEKFRKYVRLSGELNAAEGEGSFIEGFRLCALLMTEAIKTE